MTREQAREWLRETDRLRAEYSALAVMDDRVMRSADRRRLDRLSCELTIRNQYCETVLRAVVGVDDVEVMARA